MIDINKHREQNKTRRIKSNRVFPADHMATVTVLQEYVERVRHERRIRLITQSLRDEGFDV
jgi:hypothetical protein